MSARIVFPPFKMTHLVILHHGLWGNESHMQPVLDTLLKHNPDLDIRNCNENAGTKTYDGIDYCADRLLIWISQILETSKYDKISFVGYSLGGLIIRYCVGKMYKQGLFHELKPMNFVTIASPHLGVRKPSQFSWNRLLNGAINFFGTRVGPQLTCSDDFRDGRGLLDIMGDPDHSFWKGLDLFEQKILFANITNDRSVRQLFLIGIVRQVSVIRIHFVNTIAKSLTKNFPVLLK